MDQNLHPLMDVKLKHANKTAICCDHSLNVKNLWQIQFDGKKYIFAFIKSKLAMLKKPQNQILQLASQNVHFVTSTKNLTTLIYKNKIIQEYKIIPNQQKICKLVNTQYWLFQLFVNYYGNKYQQIKFQKLLKINIAVIILIKSISKLLQQAQLPSAKFEIENVSIFQHHNFLQKKCEIVLTSNFQQN
eukprot:TRINITY_DN3444_c0_g2_i6.p3 TRINITY_DN3444_c0_g2~~TRINITY_DN3444_c0_g2_i6.p3  ORF type:complete len:188 (+),score=-7.78 TRINITY_DN3444_c0_g2_i6:251-814(+)